MLETRPDRANARSAPNIKLVLALCCIAYIVTSGGHFGSTDEEDLYHNTQLLVDRFAGLASPGREVTSGTQATYRAPQEVGQSLISLPWYWAGQIISRLVHPRWHTWLTRLVMTSFNIVITVLTVWILHQWVRQFTGPKTSVVVSGLYGLGSLAWPYSQTFYREPLVGLSLLGSFWLACRFRQSLRRQELLGSVALMLLAIATKVTSAIAVPWWLVCIVPRPIRLRRSQAMWLAVAVASTVVLGCVVISAKLPTLQSHVQEIWFDIQHDRLYLFWIGFRGLLLSPGKGLVVCAPPVLLSLAGSRLFWSRHRRESVAVWGVFASYVISYSTRHGWHGGACWGPRYLLPVLPLLMLPAGEVVAICFRPHAAAARHTRFVQTTIAVVAVLGIVVQLSAVSIFALNYYSVQARAGVIGPESLDGGPGYLSEVFFDPAHSPVWGQAVLAVKRTVHLLQYGKHESVGVFPTIPGMLWNHIIELDTLDFWWLHRLLMAPDHVAPNRRLGVVLAPPENSWLQLAQQGGAQFNRWQVNWRDVEPSPGQFDFEQTDRQLQAMYRSGVQPAILLTYPPDWAIGSDSRVPNGLYASLESEHNLWAHFVRETVRHYPEVMYWEIWNEPDMDIYWGGSVQDYLQLLRVSYTVIKSTNPNAQVIMAGLAYWTEPAFLEQFLDLLDADSGAVQHDHYFDISAWHWYGRASDLYDKVVWARDLMAEHNLDKPIWINETNAIRWQDDTGAVEQIEWTVSPPEQAAFIVQACANAFAAGADKIFVFRLEDTLFPDGVGLLTHEQVPYPAYTAFQSVAEYIGGAAFVHRTFGQGITQIVFEHPDGTEIRVVWNETPAAKFIQIPTGLERVQVAYPSRKSFVQQTQDGTVDLLLPPATAHNEDTPQDYFVGGMPVFVVFDIVSTRR